MINLLPPSYATSIRFGRRNAALRRWVIGTGLAILGLTLIMMGGSLYLDSQAKQLSRDIESIQSQLQAQNLSKVQSDAKELSGSIKLINQVLSREIRFSELIQEIGQVLPPGTVLSGLTLSSEVNDAFNLTANTTDHQSAAQLAANLKDPKNELFGSVDIISVTCKTSNNPYKCDALYRVLFSKDTKIRFLNVAKEDQ